MTPGAKTCKMTPITVGIVGSRVSQATVWRERVVLSGVLVVETRASTIRIST